MSALVRLLPPLEQQTSLADHTTYHTTYHTSHHSPHLSQMDLLTIDTEDFYTTPRRSQRNLDRANRTILHTAFFVSVVPDAEKDSEEDELIMEDPPSPGPSVPNGKFVILVFVAKLIIQTNNQVSKYVRYEIVWKYLTDYIENLFFALIKFEVAKTLFKPLQTYQTLPT